MLDDTKTCLTCSKVKSLDDFPLYTGNRRHGPKPNCFPCERARSREYYQGARERKTRWWDNTPPQERSAAALKNKYGLSLEDYRLLLESQGGKCAIEACTNTPSDIAFHVDHDHKCCPIKSKTCGKCVRGLLCALCNQGLGQFRDDPELLRSAASYLERKTANG